MEETEAQDITRESRSNHPHTYGRDSPVNYFEFPFIQSSTHVWKRLVA